MENGYWRREHTRLSHEGRCRECHTLMHIQTITLINRYSRRVSERPSVQDHHIKMHLALGSNPYQTFNVT